MFNFYSAPFTCRMWSWVPGVCKCASPGQTTWRLCHPSLFHVLDNELESFKETILTLHNNSVSLQGQHLFWETTFLDCIAFTVLWGCIHINCLFTVHGLNFQCLPEGQRFILFIHYCTGMLGSDRLVILCGGLSLSHDSQRVALGHQQLLDQTC